MDTDQCVRTVRRQLALGRLLPLGGAPDGAWIAERAAVRPLRESADTLPGVRTGRICLHPAEPDAAPPASAAPAPPSALPPGPLRISVQCLAAADHPLPALAERLRDVLLQASQDRLGLHVTEVDVTVTGFTGGPARVDPAPRHRRHPGAEAPAGDAATDAVSRAVRAVPGVARLEPHPCRLLLSEKTVEHLLVQVLVSADSRALDVACRVRDAAREAAGRPVTVAVLVTDIE